MAHDNYSDVGYDLAGCVHPRPKRTAAWYAPQTYDYVYPLDEEMSSDEVHHHGN